MPFSVSATIHPASNFNAIEDAVLLYKAMKGLGTDEKAIIQCICKRSNAQRQQVRAAFKEVYNKDLTKELKGEMELGGPLGDVIQGLLKPTAEFVALEIRKAIRGPGTDEAILIEIMCASTNEEMRAILAAYKSLFSRDLAKDIQDEITPTGRFKQLIIALCHCLRSDDEPVDEELAERSAQALADCPASNYTSSASVFTELIAKQNQAQLQRCFERFREITGRDIEDRLRQNFQGFLLEGYLTVVKSVKNRAGLFAEVLHRALEQFKHSEATRIIISRSEIDLADIKQEYRAMYRTTLEHTIHVSLLKMAKYAVRLRESIVETKTLGCFRTALIELLRGNYETV